MQELELRIETQKQTLQARDESIKKLLEMLQNKGMGECSSSILLLFYVTLMPPHTSVPLLAAPHYSELRVLHGYSGT